MQPGSFTLTVIAAAIALAGPAAAQPSNAKADLIVGTWTLNRALSKFEPGPPPEKRVITFTMVGDALKESMETTRTFRNEFQAGGLGGTETSEYTAPFDGTFVPISNSGLTFVALKRVDGRTIERTGRVGPEVVETSTREVSADGKRLTITTQGSYAGMDYASVQVFDRAKR
ncbi:MAG TPA: hypothetical protein VG871_24045 [Vicinamibacterales bacterium]|nr:hypothetical protein [Vicinamibacterales bacterium]